MSDSWTRSRAIVSHVLMPHPQFAKSQLVNCPTTTWKPLKICWHSSTQPNQPIGGLFRSVAMFGSSPSQKEASPETQILEQAAVSNFPQRFDLVPTTEYCTTQGTTKAGHVLRGLFLVTVAITPPGRPSNPNVTGPQLQFFILQCSNKLQSQILKFATILVQLRISPSLRYHINHHRRSRNYLEWRKVAPFVAQIESKQRPSWNLTESLSSKTATTFSTKRSGNAGVNHFSTIVAKLQHYACVPVWTTTK